jgi:hypothetical protein
MVCQVYSTSPVDFLGLVNGCWGIVKKICYLPGSHVHISFVWIPIVPVTTTELGSHYQEHNYHLPMHRLLQSKRVKELLSMKQQLISATRIFLGPFFCCNFSSQNVAWYSLPEILQVGPAAKESMKLLQYDTARRAALGFELDTYGMDLTENISNED